MHPGSAYTIKVHRDGRIEYEGKTLVRVLGRRETKIASSEVERIFRHAEEKKFFSLDSSYPARGAGEPTAVISLRSGGKSKTIEYGAYSLGKPYSDLRELANLIENSGEVRDWVRRRPLYVTADAAFMILRRGKGCERCKIYEVTHYEKSGEIEFLGIDGVQNAGGTASLNAADSASVFREVRELFASERARVAGGRSTKGAVELTFKEHGQGAGATLAFESAAPIAKIERLLYGNESMKAYLEYSIPFVSDPKAFLKYSVEQGTLPHGAVFEVVFYLDGGVTFYGIRDTRARGLQKARLGAQALEELKKRSHSAEMNELADQYGSSGTDVGLSVVSIRRAEGIKRIAFTGTDGLPPLKDIENEVVRLLHEKRWVQ